MKTLSVFVAVAIVLTVMCSQQSSAVPVLQGEDLEETIFLEIPGGAMNETVMDSMKVRACSNTPDSDLKKLRCSFRCRRGRCRLRCKL
uniref:Hepcidin n=1 Tax=Gouania willdenowi TaxID=441366 RepID=A0A8C5ET55_GOUWI